VDLPFEESGELDRVAREKGLCLVQLIAPTTPEARARRILKDARGFVYYIMFRGVTGARGSTAGDAAERLAGLRRATDLPIAAGFGVSSAEQAAEVAKTADAVVVGSALVRAAQDGRLGSLVRDLAGALHGAGRR